jgi:leukotriene-A4 hydrolase
MVPCQDSPGVKMPYTAKIRSPKELTVLMSGLRKGSEVCSCDSTKACYHFEQPVPIPSYLIAIVVGDLVSRDIGPRSKVWSEKETVEEAAFEFDETEKMISLAEELLGPYVWGVYDLLILPPSFPYGGMENPCLTFVTPTCIAGDKSLAFVVAHEVTHSWTGNLVTNRNPEHFWLNEGHTVFVERKIAGRMLGEKIRHFLALDGWTELRNQIDRIEYTQLVPKLKGVDPDDAFSIVPYEKGSNLLMYLEQKLGGPEVFEPFLKAYIQEFKFKSIVTDDWKAFLYKFFSDKKAILDEIEWNEWLYAPGMPPVKPHYDKTLTNACAALATRWTEATDDLSQFQESDLREFSAFQTKGFLALLLEQGPLAKEKIVKMEELYHFNSSKNAEIRFRWLRLCIRARVDSAVPLALSFVSEQGRMKFVRPLYRDLYDWEDVRQQAHDNYHATCIQMHPVTAMMVAKDLRVSSAPAQ